MMRNDPDSPTLFYDHKELQDVVWECAYKILVVGRYSGKVPREEIEALSEDLLRWCPPRELYGKHWTPEEQMQWLVVKVRDKGEAVSLKNLRQMLLDKFDPPPPADNSFEGWDRKWKEWEAEAIAEGKCPRCLGRGRKRNGDFCECARGEAEREEAREAETANQQPVTRRPVGPSSLRFASDGRILPPKRRPRP